ncbi:hypothetical protein [Hahella ganghwensis]|uniref:hypothetical protein n=1 Tax=Hahella ganghwensis TaxID=286420 RepID=UPI00035C3B42|nr:hypothetical protein [Hahella ganghwensis]
MQTDPDDFYVKVDGSELDTAYWVIRAVSKQRAEELLQEATEELVLGNTEIIGIQPYVIGELIKNEAVTPRVSEMSAKIGEVDDVQLAAWISSKGRLW